MSASSVAVPDVIVKKRKVGAGRRTYARAKYWYSGYGWDKEKAEFSAIGEL